MSIYPSPLSPMATREPPGAALPAPRAETPASPAAILAPSQMRDILRAAYGPERWARHAARALGVSRSEVWRWAQGTRQIPRRRLIRLRDLLAARREGIEREFERRRAQLDAERRSRLQAVSEAAWTLAERLRRNGR